MALEIVHLSFLGIYYNIKNTTLICKGICKPILISKSKCCIIMCIIDNFRNGTYNCLQCKVFRSIQDNPSQNILRLAFILFKTSKFMALVNDMQCWWLEDQLYNKIATSLQLTLLCRGKGRHNHTLIWVVS